MLHMTASDPLFAEWNQTLTNYAALINPTCFVDTMSTDVNSAEYKADVAAMKAEVVTMFEELTR